MSELTLEAVELLLDKQTKAFDAKLDGVEKRLTAKIESTAEDLGEQIGFLTQKAAYRADMKDFIEHFDKKFADQAVSLTFIESQLSASRKDLQQLAKRTKEDDSAFVKELLKMKNRLDQFERDLKKLKAVHA